MSSISDNLWRHWRLIWSLARRDLAARYRGSVGDALWAVWNPLLQMATFYFVFGVVMKTRFPGMGTQGGYASYLIAGMLPWLAVQEALARAPGAMVENRHLVKKTIFPFEIVAVQHVLVALVTQAIGTAIFLLARVVAYGALPWTVVWVPLLLIPQVLLTLGLAWALSAVGVFVRDLIQMMGPLLTVLFYITPICYSETDLPRQLAGWVWLNPVFVLVKAWRDSLLDGRLPDWEALGLLSIAGLAAAALGYRLFSKLRPAFADVL
jgi:lipopolysaccharide transport system permease protein